MSYWGKKVFYKKKIYSKENNISSYESDTKARGWRKFLFITQETKNNDHDVNSDEDIINSTEKQKSQTWKHIFLGTWKWHEHWTRRWRS